MPTWTLPDNPLTYIQDILGQHKDKNFVQRILTPQSFPTYDFGHGMYGTHRMAWGSAGDKYLVYPTIIQRQNGKLQQLNDDEAMSHAQTTGEYIPFNTSEEANWFSRNYKQIWGGR